MWVRQSVSILQGRLALLLITYALFYNEYFKNCIKEFKKRNIVMLKRILNIGLPIMFENAVVQIGFLILGIHPNSTWNSNASRL